ncbi:MAG: serine O-acetyltransferase [Defluviitaleaceae bacterium]|nr:serine O-acetyltransferase [Defluviitaleaceae bacterium]
MTAKRIIQAIKQNDPAIRKTREAWLYPGLWAVIYHRLANKLYRSRRFFLARLVSQWARKRTGIEIHPGATIGHGLFIDHGAGVVIGETCVIGDDVLIFHGVTLGGTGKIDGKRHPTVESGAIIGAGAIILGDIKIGTGAKIGAGALVIADVPENSTVVGEPARNTQLEASLRNEIAALKARIDALELAL